MAHNVFIRKVLLARYKGKSLIDNYKNFKEEFFECQTNGVISDSIVQNWTIQALECYQLKSDCANCPITKARYSFKCQMKHIVDILLKTKGKPNEKEILNQATPLQNDIVA